MAFFNRGALLLWLLPAVAVYAHMQLDCRPGFVTLVWTESRPQVNLALLRLGSCYPASVAGREAVFNVDLKDCNFNSLVTGDHMVYMNELIYDSFPESPVQPFNHKVICTYDRPEDWYPSIFEPVFDTYGEAQLVFHTEIMDADFKGPAESSTFSLGSFIPIMASVEQVTHQPLLLLLEECFAADAPQMSPDSNLYPIIANKGCLLDSRISRSKFEPRRKASEILLSLQAFRFALGKEVYIHCKLVAWDPNGLDNTRKACHFVKDHGWELLDNPTYSGLCDCCDSSCSSRKTRSTGSGRFGVEYNTVIGPLTITES